MLSPRLIAHLPNTDSRLTITYEQVFVKRIVILTFQWAQQFNTLVKRKITSVHKI